MSDSDSVLGVCSYSMSESAHPFEISVWIDRTQRVRKKGKFGSFKAFLSAWWTRSLWCRWTFVPATAFKAQLSYLEQDGPTERYSNLRSRPQDSQSPTGAGHLTYQKERSSPLKGLSFYPYLRPALSMSILRSGILYCDSRLDLPTYLIQFRATRFLAVWESAHHLMVKPWYDVHVHVEYFLRSGSTI